MFIPGKYIKYVNWNKAVLWKDKQISLNPVIVDKFQEHKTEKVLFVDELKNKVHIALVSDLNKHGMLKKEGQEPQWYYPITIFVDKVFKKELNDKIISN